jgi:hypothetical protein
MISFLNFLLEEYLEEKGPITSLGTMASIVGSRNGEKHAQKYYGKDALDKNKKFTLWKDHNESGAKAGQEVEVSDVVKKDGHYQGVVKGNNGKKSYIPMNNFYKPKMAGGRVGKDQEGAEQDQVAKMQEAIEKAKGNSPYIRVHLGNGKWAKVAGIKRVDKDFANKQGYTGSKPKADSVFVDEKGTPVDYQSLKAEGSFQQLGGVEDHRNKDTKKLHPVVQTAVDQLAAHAKKHKIAGGIPEGLMYHADFNEKDPETRKMIARSTYGRDFGSSQNSVTNVNRLIHGGIAFKPPSQTDPEAAQHKGIPTFDLDARQFQNTGDHKTSDIIPVKAVVRKSGGQNQLGTGGRIMMIPKESENYLSSIDTNNSQGPEKDRAARIKEIEAKKKQIQLNKMAKNAGASRAKPISTDEMMSRANKIEKQKASKPPTTAQVIKKQTAAKARNPTVPNNKQISARATTIKNVAKPPKPQQPTQSTPPPDVKATHRMRLKPMLG